MTLSPESCLAGVGEEANESPARASQKPAKQPTHLQGWAVVGYGCVPICIGMVGVNKSRGSRKLACYGGKLLLTADDNSPFGQELDHCQCPGFVLYALVLVVMTAAAV